jgi:hypothetical protein
MLFLFKIGVDENDPDKKKIDAQCYPFVLLYFLPCFFHFAAPMNIIEHENAGRQSLFE